jgi:hypothetical protein
MRTKLIAISAATAFVMTAAPAFADHNSKNGEGTANMPNDIHNTRVETLEANDNEAFRDFVKYGEGSDSVNRFESDETIAPKAQKQQGNANSTQSQAQSQAGNRTNTQEKKMLQTRETSEQQTQDKKMQQVREQSPGMDGKDRSVRTQSNRESRNTNRTTTQRSTGRRGGGGGRGGR